MNEISLFIKKALEKGLNFYCIRPPRRKEADNLIFGASTRLLPGLHRNAFVMSPFDNIDEGTFSIPPDMTTIADLELAGYMAIKKPLYDTPANATPRHIHQREVEEIARRLRIEGGGKTVAARVIISEGIKSPGEIFETLCSTYPDAYVFLTGNEKSGIWAGATPELLIAIKGSRLKTMALAGTRPHGSYEKWDDKNRKEQEIVRHFICNVLEEAGLNPRCSETFTMPAGPVEHLCTEIEASFQDPPDICNLLKHLSPTPALCGYPKESALADIHRLENFQRGYYGGYLGFISENGDMELRVNLRSTMLSGGKAYLFCGGGIMADSLPDKEWDETERKASTLLSIISANDK